MSRTPLDELLRALAASEPERDAADSMDDIAAWRRRIDAIDRVLLALLNERARAANLIGHVKKRLGLPVYVPSREEQVLRQVREANGGPLNDRAVTHLFERIIDETRSLERQKYQDEESDKGPERTAPDTP